MQPPDFLAFAQSKGFKIPPELDGIESPRRADEAQPSPPDNEPIAKRKAPDTFIAAKSGMPFDVDAMPGTKADFRALAIKFDDELDQKTSRTFDDYLAGLVRFKQGAQQATLSGTLPRIFRAAAV